MADQHSLNPAQLYEDYLVPGLHAPWTPILLQHADPRPGQSVLDLACGTGIVTRHVAPMVGADGEVSAVDVSPRMLAVGREVCGEVGVDVEWHECGADSLPFDEGRFDRVICQQAFQFFTNRDAAAGEMNRVLSDGGRAAVSVWLGLDHHEVYEALIEAEARFLDRPLAELATPFMMGDPEALRRIFDRGGFGRVEIHRESHEARFSDPDRFVALTVLAAAAVLPETEMDEEGRNELVAAVRRDVEPVVQKHISGDEITFPMHAHVVVAEA